MKPLRCTVGEAYDDQGLHLSIYLFMGR